MDQDQQRQILKKLIALLTKYNLVDSYSTHREHTARAFDRAGDDNVAKMSAIKRTFADYIQYEDLPGGGRSTRYKWSYKQFREDHADLYGDESVTGMPSIKQMVVALQDEIVAAKKDVQRNSLPISKIEGIRLGLDNQVYACFLKLNEHEEPNVKDGVPCEIRNQSGVVAHATVIDYNAEKQCLHVTCPKDLVKAHGRGLKVVIDLTWLLGNMIDKLSKYENDPSPHSGPIGKFFLPKITLDNVPYHNTLIQGSLNTSQFDAYSAALNRDITLIWGPPGTGKSLTLAHVILALARVSGKTLVTCISNAALDSLIKAIIKLLQIKREDNAYAFHPSSFVRLGVSRSPTILDDPWFNPENEELIRCKLRIKVLDKYLADPSRSEQELEFKDEKIKLFQRIKSINEERLSRAKIVFATAAKAVASSTSASEENEEDRIELGLSDIHFDNLVLDEVSMMYPPQFVALGLGISNRIIAAGDFRQLGPIHLSATSMALKWLNQDIFEFGKIKDRNGRVKRLPHLLQLKDHYRSHTKICDLFNSIFYEGELVPKADIAGFTTIHLEPFKGQPVIFLDLQDEADYKVKRTTKGSRRNMYSASIAAKLAICGVDAGVTNIIVITPYRVQVSIIKNLLDKAELDERRARVRVGTVHSFQGGEADLVIFDLVDSKDTKISRLYQDQQGERLFNVALSRAKSKIIILGDAQQFHDGNGHTLVTTNTKRVTNQIMRWRIRDPQKFKKYTTL